MPLLCLLLLKCQMSKVDLYSTFTWKPLMRSTSSVSLFTTLVIASVCLVSLLSRCTVWHLMSLLHCNCCSVSVSDLFLSTQCLHQTVSSHSQTMMSLYDCRRMQCRCRKRQHLKTGNFGKWHTVFNFVTIFIVMDNITHKKLMWLNILEQTTFPAVMDVCPSPDTYRRTEEFANDVCLSQAAR